MAEETHKFAKPLVRTNTPLPNSPRDLCIKPTNTQKVQTRSASLDPIPVAPQVKCAPRPISTNVYEYIKKNSDSPKLNDTREEPMVRSKPSVFEKKVLPLEVKAILADFENKLQYVPLPYILRVRTNV
jgi:hypothetical protein